MAKAQQAAALAAETASGAPAGTGPRRQPSRGREPDKKASLKLARSEGWLDPAAAAKLKKEVEAAKAHRAAPVAASGGKADAEEEAEDAEEAVDIGKLHQTYLQLKGLLGEDAPAVQATKKQLDAARAKRDQAKPASVRLRELEKLVERRLKRRDEAQSAVDEAEAVLVAATEELDKMQEELEEAETELSATRAKAGNVGSELAGDDLLSACEDDPEAKELFDKLQARLRERRAAEDATMADVGGPSGARPAPPGSPALDEQVDDKDLTPTQAAQRADVLAQRYMSALVPDQAILKIRIDQLRVTAKAGRSRDAGGTDSKGTPSRIQRPRSLSAGRTGALPAVSEEVAGARATGGGVGPAPSPSRRNGNPHDPEGEDL